MMDVVEMMRLYQDPWFTFRIGEDRIIPRFHLEGIPGGQQVSVFNIDPGTGERLGLLATAFVGEEDHRRSMEAGLTTTSLSHS